jgi:hypothetical protein
MQFINIPEIRAAADMIRSMLGDDFDDVTFLDTLDGETDAMDMIGKMIMWRVEAAETEKAMKEVAATYKARADRFAAQQVAANKALGMMLDAIKEKKVAHPLGTVSRTDPRMSLRITDEKQIPWVMLVHSVAPDNAAVKKRLEAGENVPGAELVPGEPGIMLRVK